MDNGEIANMNENNDAGSEKTTKQNSHQPLSSDQINAHLSASYNNSQSTVRFLDTKAAAIIGCVPVLLGIIAALFNWLKNHYIHGKVECTTSQDITVLLYLGVSALVLIYISSRAVHEAFSALTPRDTGNAEPSVLFPFNGPGFKSRLELFTHNSATETDICYDYHRQILRMGEIVEQKIKHTSRAIRRTQHLLIAAVICVSIAIVFVGCNALSATPVCSSCNHCPSPETATCPQVNLEDQPD